MKAAFVAVLLVAAFAGSALAAVEGDADVVIGEEHDWKKCVDIPALKVPACGVVFVDPQTLTVGVKVTIADHTVFERHWSGSKLCATEKELLKLLEVIPALAPYKKVIDEVIKIFGRLPGHVFDVCIDLVDTQWVGQYEFKGCANLDLTLVCWKDKCAYKGAHKLGCFDIHIPHKANL